MIKSMTGFAHKETSQDIYQVSLDLRSINHRYCEINLHIPQEISCWEEDLRKLVGEKVSRGKVDVYLNIEYLKKPSGKITFNRTAAEEIVFALEKAKKELNLAGQLDINSLILLPNLIEVETAKLERQPSLLQLIKEVLSAALESLEESRRREGEALYRAVEEELQQISHHISRIEELMPSLHQEYHDKLKKKIEEYLGNIPLDENRLLQEVAFLLEKSDVTEEITRIKSHLKQSHQLLLSEEPAGRQLDFLMQELHREVSTMGAKFRNPAVLPDILAIRTAVEKIRQQVQNIE